MVSTTRSEITESGGGLDLVAGDDGARIGVDDGGRDAEVGELLLDEARGVFQRLGRHRLDGGRRSIQQRQVGQRGVFTLVTVHRGRLRLADGGAFAHGLALDPDGLADVGVAVRCAAM